MSDGCAGSTYRSSSTTSLPTTSALMRRPPSWNSSASPLTRTSLVAPAARYWMGSRSSPRRGGASAGGGASPSGTGSPVRGSTTRSACWANAGAAKRKRAKAVVDSRMTCKEGVVGTGHPKLGAPPPLSTPRRHGLERGAEAAAGVLQHVHLLRVAEPEPVATVLGVGEERVAGDARHAGPLDERVRRRAVVGEPAALARERLEVGEDVVGAVGAVDGEAARFEGVAHQRALGRVVGLHPRVVVLRHREGGGDAVLERRGRADVDEVADEPHLLDDRRRGDGVAEAPSGHVERLREAREGDGPLVGAGEAPEGDVPVPVVGHVLVDLVGDGPEVVLLEEREE